MLEVGAEVAGEGVIDVEHLGEEHVLRYDRDGDGHYNVASAYIKSVRGSDVDAALHWLAVMIVAGEDPRFIARRMIILASEDVGMADPAALGVAVAAADAVAYVGLPEARLNLAQGTIYLCLAPKSNSVYRAIDEAITDVRAGKGRTVPPALQDTHSGASRAEGAGVGYHYPHDSTAGVVAEQYVDDDIAHQTYYHPTGRGEEARYGKVHDALRKLIRRKMVNTPDTT
jgi:putative ATPase